MNELKIGEGPQAFALFWRGAELIARHEKTGSEVALSQTQLLRWLTARVKCSMFGVGR
jgi:hypothetical protein